MNPPKTMFQLSGVHCRYAGFGIPGFGLKHVWTFKLFEAWGMLQVWEGSWVAWGLINPPIATHDPPSFRWPFIETKRP